MDDVDKRAAAVSTDAGDAVGVPASWYVAIVRHNTEKASAERLSEAGYTTYLPTQRDVRVWRNGRRAIVTRVVIPTMIFVRCTEAERRQIVMLPYISRFLSDRASGRGIGNVARIPDRQIQTLRFMLGQSDKPVYLVSDFRKGDRVKVVRGALKGLEGSIIKTPEGASMLTVGIDYLGCARVEIEPSDVKLVTHTDTK